ncbi:putative acyl-CoA transferase/carnitine dehydratase [Schinkia azotoformans MEV2011]|uniref:Putative acyl-CoA transferase/carnitine dehydratase n=1 Tax=Schinkia azotoformans MEV2011 TaxID=1348973 RepID=A0A072NX74_SCHAZ|nr:L-carnitine CoA-transferase [Schinkia azotoformans]KEF37830.1 putative acyl-CoA transferase/carnitine dehydratase [Schinkia azotoformans MEV2011]MEC1696512.1 L-carnitine CoA-transferase [Schinkia azotoformans]MEC1725997.1 L-carnitine CoA-transferase [Schinkia azotoformans]MEC1745802.1 L-carnitine CoA-transferase [Schinkia azotoformans]MEC1770056.1 L-carnitine CoA-transferase [Schinkia azotoformans]
MSTAISKPAFGNLHGLKVVYSAVEIAGPEAAQLMAEWGADVTWIENTFNGDSMRDTTYVKELERRNQRSLSLDIFSEEGREVFLKLIETADIFIESSKGPAFARRGITDELLWEHNKSLVIVHVSGYGQYGDMERVNRAAYDQTAQAFSGYLSQNGSPEQPMIASPYTGDYFTSQMVVGSALAALYKAQKTGVGESIDIAMYEVMLRMGAYYMMDYLNAGILYPRAGAKHQNLCGIGVYKCKDGFLSLCLYGAKQNKAILERIGLGYLWGTEEYPEGTTALWLDGPKAELIEQKIEEYLLSMPVDEVEKDFSDCKIAANKVMTFEELPKHPHFIAREAFVEWETIEGKKCKGPNIFPKFKNNPGQIWRGMPTLGMDTESILTEIGYSCEKIHELAEKGIIKKS